MNPDRAPKLFRSRPLRRIGLLGALFVLAARFAAAQDIDPASGNAQPFPGTPVSGYALAWSDEFNASAVNTAKWDFRTGVRFWSTQQAQNNSVSGGLLHILLKKESVGATDYTSGGLISKRAVRYGFYEARMRVPPGRGWHTSFWMISGGTPVPNTSIELDVIENDSINPLRYSVNTHRHLPAPHVTYGTKNVTTPSLTADFHVFGCEFTPTTIRYFFDGALVQTVDATLFAHPDLNIWLTSVAAPLGGTTSVDDTQLPAVAQFDYARFYEPYPVPAVSIISPTSAAITLADSATTLRVEANVTVQSGTPTVAWSLVDGPGSVTFSTPSAAQTSATFSAAGTYTLQCAATNAGGTGTDRVYVGVAAPVTIQLRQQSGGYQHTATVIRGDQPTWNAGSRNQLLVGRTTSPFRSLFSFDLSLLATGATISEAALDLKTVSGGVGTVGALRLRSLSATPVEGTGISDGTTGSNLGTGTGATWTTRTGGSLSGDLWSSAGGDFAPAILSETPGFDATVSGQTVTLPNAPALTAAVQSAHAAAQPLNLILSAANESVAGTAYVRIASDDDSLESNRPVLGLSFTGNSAPAITPGSSPAAITGVPAALGGSVSFATSSQWRLLSGPGNASFSNAASPTSNVTFNQAGAYLLELSATGAFAVTSRTLAINVTTPDPATYAGWQVLTWPGISDPNIIGPGMDPDFDRLTNLLEWALRLDPKIPNTFRPDLTRNALELQYTYTRRRTAPGAATFQIEWSDTLGNDWSSAGVIQETPVSLSASEESVTVRIPAGSASRRFLHLKVRN